MRPAVDAAREAGDDGIARLREPARQPLGEGEAGGGRVARADDGDRRLVEHRDLPAHSDHRGRAVDLAQQRRIAGLVATEEARAELARHRHLGLDLGDGGDADRPAGTLALEKVRQRVKRRLG